MTRPPAMMPASQGSFRMRWRSPDPSVSRKIPLACVSHQRPVMGQRFSWEIPPVRTREPTEMKAPRREETPAPSTTSATTSRHRPREGEKPAPRRSQAARTASAVLPAPVPTAPRTGVPDARVTAISPAKIQGQARGPAWTTKARASPLGSQMRREMSTPVSTSSQSSVRSARTR